MDNIENREKVCKTCKHWRHIRDEDYGDWRGPHGECHLIWEFPQDDVPAWLYATDKYYGDKLAKTLDFEVSLITMPTFGCNQWEENK